MKDQQSDLDKKLELADERSMSRKIRDSVIADQAEASRDKRIVAPFRTLPRELRPRAVNLAALRKIKVGPIFASDPNALKGMRGVPVGQRVSRPGTATRLKGGVRHWMEHRADRRARRLVARASRAANR